MHTILGAGGPIATELARQLPSLTAEPLRLVSRQPRPVNPSDELLAADLTDEAQVRRAVAGSAVVYLTAGLPYDTATWQRDWPPLMRHVLAACEEYGARLVFFDNVYAYGPVAGPMTEATPYHPSSAKGEVRAQIAQQLLDAVQAGRVEALIARAADFYGPATPNALPNLLVLDKLQLGQEALWLGSADVPHSLTFTPDAGRATALLGTTPSAFNQTWHLPTAAPALTARQFAQQAATAYRVPLALTVLPEAPLPELRELMYQYEQPYVFDSRKFEQQFFTATPYAEGIRRVVEAHPA